MKTVRRDTLKKLAENKQLVMVSSYNFDDLHGAETDNRELPVRIMEGHGNFKEGFCNMLACDFTSEVGRAYYENEEKGIIRLRVHSNHSVTLRKISREEWYKLQPLREFCSTYQTFIRDLAAKHGKSEQQVHVWWREYADSVSGEGGQSALQSEFEQWYKDKLAA